MNSWEFIVNSMQSNANRAPLPQPPYQPLAGLISIYMYGSVSFGPKSIDSSVSFGDTVIESSESFETKSIDSSVSFVLQQESYMNLKVNASRYALSHRC